MAPVHLKKGCVALTELETWRYQGLILQQVSRLLQQRSAVVQMCAQVTRKQAEAAAELFRETSERSFLGHISKWHSSTYLDTFQPLKKI